MLMRRAVQNGAGLIVQGGARLVDQDGTGLIVQDSSRQIVQDGTRMIRQSGRALRSVLRNDLPKGCSWAGGSQSSAQCSEQCQDSANVGARSSQPMLAFLAREEP